MNYQKAGELLRTARNPSQGKPIDNNTRIFQRDTSAGFTYVIRLHNTDIITFDADGSITLNTGGWKTVTTKERMNKYAPCRIWSDRGVWSVGYQGKTYLYADGMRLETNGTVTGDAPESAKDEDKRLRKAAKEYAAKFTDELFNGKIEAQSMGDCWGCCMKAGDGTTPMGGKDHIVSHFEECYFVPSLLVNALDTVGASQATMQTAQAFMHKKPEYAYSNDRGHWVAKDIEKAIRKYCLKQLGMAA